MAMYLITYGIVGLLFLFGMLAVASWIRTPRVSEQKLSNYESGETPLGTAWIQINIRFYVIAIVFLLFEIEIVLLFPWAVVLGNQQALGASEGVWAWFTLVEVFVFIALLLLGLVYLWRNGHLDVLQPPQHTASYESPVPGELYDRVNQQYS